MMKKTWDAVAGPPRVVMASSTLDAIPADAGILLTDIDRTISCSSSIGFMIRHNTAVEPLRHSVETLTDLARRYRIVYLTARSWWQIPKTVAWLSLYAFPVGPIIHRDYLTFLVSSRVYKAAAIEGLRKRFQNIIWGVGDKINDILAYAENNVTPILITTERRKSRMAAKAGMTKHVVTTWREIATIIASEGSSRGPSVAG